MTKPRLWRHYLLPVYVWKHPTKGGDTIPYVLLNGKRLMPPKLQPWEGHKCLFGGGAEEGEEKNETLIRETKEEIPPLLSSLTAALAAERALTLSYEGEPYDFTITAYYAGVWCQRLYRTLAADCHEGEVSLVSLDEVRDVSGGGNLIVPLYARPMILELAQNILTDRALISTAIEEGA